MLTSSNRLKRHRDFSTVYRRGRSYVSDLFILYVLHTDLPGQLCGFSVSKKVGKAYIRNRIKRRASEIIRPRLSGMKPGLRLVFVARKAAAEAEYAPMSAAISSLISKAGL